MYISQVINNYDTKAPAKVVNNFFRNLLCFEVIAVDLGI